MNTNTFILVIAAFEAGALYPADHQSYWAVNGCSGGELNSA
jgi:hypothetical protein